MTSAHIMQEASGAYFEATLLRGMDALSTADL